MIEGILGGLMAAVGGALIASIGWTRQRLTSPTAPVEGTPTSALPLTDNEDLFEHAPVGLCQLALDGRILRANCRLQALCGCDEDQLQARFLPELVCSDRDVGEILKSIAERADECELRGYLLHSRGYAVWVSVMIRAVQRRSRPVHLLVAVNDIGEYKRVEQAVQSEQGKFVAVAAQVPVAVSLLSPDGQIIFANEELEAITGRAKESFFETPANYLELIHPDDVVRVRTTVRAQGIGGNYDVNYRIRRDNGEIRHLRQRGRGVYDIDGRLLYAVATAMDITAEMIARDELHELNGRLRETNLRLRESVRLDSLTRCLNRTALFEEIEKALLLARRYRRISTVVFFDLNDFKSINDSFGHHIGDRALKAFAEQIKMRLRVTDELGRYGGDEFVALLRETDADQAAQLVMALPPVVIDNEDGNSIIVRFSAGIASSSDEIESVDNWLRIADGLMYRQKVRILREGGGRV